VDRRGVPQQAATSSVHRESSTTHYERGTDDRALLKSASQGYTTAEASSTRSAVKGSSTTSSNTAEGSSKDVLGEG
jgi:hypothetical protein